MQKPLGRISKKICLCSMEHEILLASTRKEKEKEKEDRKTRGKACDIYGKYGAEVEGRIGQDKVEHRNPKLFRRPRMIGRAG